LAEGKVGRRLYGLYLIAPDQVAKGSRGLLQISTILPRQWEWAFSHTGIGEMPHDFASRNDSHSKQSLLTFVI
jgi:hypothetical protein